MAMREMDGGEFSNTKILNTKAQRHEGQLVGGRVEVEGGGLSLGNEVRSERVGWIEDEVEELERWDGME
jgi:hypothetical protein